MFNIMKIIGSVIASIILDLLILSVLVVTLINFPPASKWVETKVSALSHYFIDKAGFLSVKNNVSLMKIDEKYRIIINKSFFEKQGFGNATSAKLICRNYKSVPIANPISEGENHLVFRNHSCNDNFSLLLTKKNGKTAIIGPFGFDFEE